VNIGNMHKKGFTLIEILIAAFVLALVITGLACVFLAGKRLILHTRSRMQAAELGRYFLSPFQMQVRQDQWASNCLGTGTLANCPDEIIGTGWGMDRNYTVSYTVANNYPISNLNKVKVKIAWSEE